ncbi:MAG: hypothetical protein RL375_319, partial [Pseudomonadota bacterium]
GATSANFADKHVGTGKTITVAGLTLSGADAGNYTFTVDPVSADITAKAIAVSGLSGVNKVYDATNVARLTGTAGLTGGGASSTDGKVIGLDDVVVGGTTSATFADKHVGTGKAITVSGLTLSGADAGNYTVTVDPISADITPKTISVSGLSGVNKVYDATNIAGLTGTAGLTGGGANATDGKVIGLDEVVVGGTTSATFADKHVGTAKAITVAGLTLNGADAANYRLVVEPVNADVTPKALVVDKTLAANKVYDGNRDVLLSGGSLVGVEAGDAVALAQFGQFDTKHAGVDKSVSVSNSLSGADAGNYTVAGLTTTASITPKDLSVADLAAASRVYDGTRQARVSGQLAGVVLGDDVALSQSGSFADKNAGIGKTVTVANSVSGADAGNYHLTTPSQTAVADITPKVLTVAGTTAAGKVYDGSTAAAISGGRVDGVIAGDALALDQLGTFDTKNVGTAKTVTVANSLSGGDAGNYALSNRSETRQADITPRTLDVIGTTAANKVFDGTTSATVAAGRLDGVVAGDDVSLTQSGAFRDPVAGVSKPVDIDSVLAGIDAFNYVLPSMRTSADILPNLPAQKAADSLKASGSRATAHSVNGNNDGGSLQVTNLMTPAPGGSPGGYVLAALPADDVPAPVNDRAPANQETDYGQLPPTKAGPMSASADTLVARASPGDLHAAAGMINVEGGARVDTRKAPSRRRAAAGVTAPVRQPSAVVRPGARVSGSASTLGSLTQVPAGGALSLPGQAATALTTTPSGGVAATADAAPAPTAQAPVVPQMKATPKPTPKEPDNGHKGAIVFGTLFAAAAGFALRKRITGKRGL